jgi:hypothetical protein
LIFEGVSNLFKAWGDKMETEQLEIGALLRRTWTVIASAPAEVGAYVVGLAAFGSFVDITYEESSGGYFLVSVASFVAGYFLLRAILRKCGLLREEKVGGFGSYFGVSLLGGLGIIFGFLLLIIPGLVLMTRWSAAFALVVAEDEGVNALSESWELTRGNFWPIFAAMLVGFVPLVVFIVAVGAGLAFSEAAVDQAAGTPAELIAGNVVGNLYGVFSTALGIAVYWMLRGEQRGISEVFA